MCAVTRSESSRQADTTSDSFIESLMDTDLYSMGAYFSDRNPELVDELIERSLAIEARGLRRFSEEEDVEIREVFRTLLTGLAVRYYKSVTG